MKSSGIETAREHLAATKSNSDLQAIRAATTALDQATRNFAEKMMEAAVSGAMRGKTMQTASEEPRPVCRLKRDQRAPPIRPR